MYFVADAFSREGNVCLILRNERKTVCRVCFPFYRSFRCKLDKVDVSSLDDFVYATPLLDWEESGEGFVVARNTGKNARALRKQKIKTAHNSELIRWFIANPGIKIEPLDEKLKRILEQIAKGEQPDNKKDLGVEIRRRKGMYEIVLDRDFRNFFDVKGHLTLDEFLAMPCLFIDIEVPLFAEKDYMIRWVGCLYKHGDKSEYAVFTLNDVGGDGIFNAEDEESLVKMVKDYIRMKDPFVVYVYNASFDLIRLREKGDFRIGWESKRPGYQTSRKFFEREREEIAIYSVLFFLFSPVFLAYSSIGYGMWEAMFFLLLSIYFLLNGRRVLPGLFFSIAFFIRYLVSLYLPLLFIFSKLKRRPFFGFLWWFIIFTICIFFTLLLLFGYNFINQTFCFHLYSKVGVAPSEQVFLYLRMNLFFVLVSLLTIFLAGPTKYKDKAVILSISLLSIDFLIFLIFRQPFFHYFILSLPFYSLLSGRLLSDASFSAKSLMIVAFLIYIFGNSSTLNFYLNPSYSSAFYQIEKIVENYTTTDSTIFGEPIMANYISLSLDRRIVNNYLDSYPQHLGLEKEHIQGVLKRQTPDLFIDLKVGNFSYSTVLGLRNYVSESYRKVGEIRIKSLTYEIFVLRSEI